MSPATATWTLRHRGTDLTVETWTGEGKEKNGARLLVDGTEVDTGATEEIGSVLLGEDTDHRTRVAWWWTGRVARCVLVEPGSGEERHRATPYAPPAGTRAARLHAWGEAHPTLWAARHVVLNLLGTAAGILGVGAVLGLLFGRLLPAIDLPDLPGLPDIAWPEWLTYLDPGRYLAPLFEWLGSWIPDWELGWLKYVIGFLIAVSIAVREVRRRRRVAGEDDQDPRA